MKNKIEGTKIGHYYLPEQLKFLYCYTCLMIILDTSDEAADLFEEVEKCWELPGCKQLLDGVLTKTQNREKFLKVALRLARLNPKEDRTLKLRDTTAMMSGIRRLICILRMDIATPNIILDEINQMRQEKEEDENKLANLNKTRNSIRKLVDVESNLKELCARIIADLDNCNNQDKKDAYTYLDIKGYLNLGIIKDDSCLLSIGQTSECLSSHADKFLIPFSYSVI